MAIINPKSRSTNAGAPLAVAAGDADATILILDGIVVATDGATNNAIGIDTGANIKPSNAGAVVAAPRPSPPPARPTCACRRRRTARRSSTWTPTATAPRTCRSAPRSSSA